MRAGLLVTLLGVIVGICSMWSCSVDRPSEALKCSSQPDCTQFPGTICSSGYCVRGTLPIDARELDAFVCPAVCGSCDTSVTPTVCTITGTGSGNIDCPAGYKCNITCGQAGACGAISCGSAASCDIDCLAADSCLGITCATKNCDITCTGVNACGNMSCTTGNCTAACTGSDACGTLSCSGGNCTETCTGGAGNAVCGNMSCSSTGVCTRMCGGAGACGTLSCSGTSDCAETCSGGNRACGTLNCGAGKCEATCQGMEGACDNVNCDSSCQCDVACDLTANICPGSMACPDPNGGQVNECEDTFGRCDSSQTPSRCRKCI